MNPTPKQVRERAGLPRYVVAVRAGVSDPTCKLYEACRESVREEERARLDAEYARLATVAAPIMSAHDRRALRRRMGTPRTPSVPYDPADPGTVGCSSASVPRPAGGDGQMDDGLTCPTYTPGHATRYAGVGGPVEPTSATSRIGVR